MNFAGVDTWAIVLAGVGGYIVGAFWYWGLSKPWMEAQGFMPESMRPINPRSHTWSPSRRTWLLP